MSHEKYLSLFLSNSLHNLLLFILYQSILIGSVNVLSKHFTNIFGGKFCTVEIMQTHQSTELFRVTTPHTSQEDLSLFLALLVLS